MTTITTDDTYITSVLLLCVTCQQPIKAWINSPQWIRVEWISSEGECQGCVAARKKEVAASGKTSTSNDRRRN